jgi:hypothetical protein
MLNSVALDRALQKPTPNRIPLSLPNCLANDFYESHVVVPSINWRFLPNEVRSAGYEGYLWINDADGVQACLLKEELRRSEVKIEVVHYYKQYQFRYQTAAKFLIAHFLRWHKLHPALDALMQTVFNHRTVLRTERIELLQYMVEQSAENPALELTPMTVALNPHTKRWFYHPKRSQHLRYLSWIMESFQESGELRKNGDSYRVTGKALATLSAYELDQQKHHDSMRNARTAHKLSMVLIIIATANIAAQLGMWWIGRGP